MLVAPRTNLQTFNIHKIMPGVQAGCILWLPKKDDIGQRLLTEL